MRMWIEKKKLKQLRDLLVGYRREQIPCSQHVPCRFKRKGIFGKDSRPTSQLASDPQLTLIPIPRSSMNFHRIDGKVYSSPTFNVQRTSQEPHDIKSSTQRRKTDSFTFKIRRVKKSISDAYEMIRHINLHPIVRDKRIPNNLF